MSASNRFEAYQQPLSGALVRRGFAHEFTDINGVLIHTVRTDNGRPPLLLIPAQMGTWQTYAKVMGPLADDFDVIAVDVRGHGSSSWTTGNYCWECVGADLAALLVREVARPAVVAGNSSGGVLAVWLGARHPELVRAIVAEDPPIFSAEMPRFRDQDRFVFQGLGHLVDALGGVGDRRLADYFRGQQMPVSETRVKQVPGWACDWMQRSLDAHTRRHPGEPAGVGGLWPKRLSELFCSLDMFDPDFARAFVDGRFYGQVDHAELAAALTCPVTLLHGNWRRYRNWGLVGAMDADDADRFRALARQTCYVRMPGNHVLHHDDPKGYVREVRAIAPLHGDR